MSRARLSPESVPSKGDYDRLTNNKYATKVLAGYFDAPKYEVGSMVSLRGSASWALRRKMPSEMAVVIQANAEIPVAAARGNKVYKLLPVGGTQTIIAEERDLKTHRVPKKKKGESR